jgi:hypothetical protein
VSVTSARVVEFRLVERTGQTVVDSSDKILNFALQARVTGGGALAAFSFDSLRFVGEPESYGTLGRDVISNFDGTYAPEIASNNQVGRGGIARTYTYEAGIDVRFNGVINTSAGSFTNGPDQEIGIVAGAAVHGALLGTPGVDTDSDGNPDGWAGNGSGATPPQGVLVPLDATIAQTYFASGQFIDLYRFRYVVSNLTTRKIHIEINQLSDITFGNQLTYSNGLWGAYGNSESSAVVFQPLDISVVPTPGCAALLAGAGLSLRRRR